VVPHVDVHGGCDEHGGAAGQGQGGEGVVGDAVGELGDDVGGGGGDEQQVGAVGGLDVADLPGPLDLEQVGDDGAVGEHLERERAHEAPGVPGHDHGDTGLLLEQHADELGGLVGRDASGDAEDYFLVREHCKTFN
jgi:hypothetical protein